MAVLDRAEGPETILNDDVTPPSATVTAPNRDESIVEGASVDLLWSATDNIVVDSVDLLLSRDDGANYEPIATDIANTGTYAWVAAAPLTALARFKVVASDHRLQEGVDVSDGAWAITGAIGVEPAVPAAFALDLASANSSSGASRIRYALPRESRVRLTIIDVRGRVVTVLRDGVDVAGVHEVVWPAASAPAGIYFVHVQAEGWKAQRRLVRLR